MNPEPHSVDAVDSLGVVTEAVARAGETLDLAARHLDSSLVEMLRTGPPWMHRTGPLATANVNENFVHHEDVRRASGESPRVIDDESRFEDMPIKLG